MSDMQPPEVRLPNERDARREVVVETVKRHVRRSTATNYDADIEYLGDALLNATDELIEKARTQEAPPEGRVETLPDLHGVTDAERWVRAFCEIFDPAMLRIGDGVVLEREDAAGTLLAWFANAIESGKAAAEQAGAASLFTDDELRALRAAPMGDRFEVRDMDSALAKINTVLGEG